MCPADAVQVPREAGERALPGTVVPGTGRGVPSTLCSMAGAITVTSPSRCNSLRKARRPGAKTPSSLVSKICTSRSPTAGHAGASQGKSHPAGPFRLEPTESDRNGPDGPPSTARRAWDHHKGTRARSGMSSPRRHPRERWTSSPQGHKDTKKRGLKEKEAEFTTKTKLLYY